MGDAERGREGRGVCVWVTGRGEWRVAVLSFYSISTPYIYTYTDIQYLYISCPNKENYVIHART